MQLVTRRTTWPLPKRLTVPQQRPHQHLSPPSPVSKDGHALTNLTDNVTTPEGTRSATTMASPTSLLGDVDGTAPAASPTIITTEPTVVSLEAVSRKGKVRGRQQIGLLPRLTFRLSSALFLSNLPFFRTQQAKFLFGSKNVILVPTYVGIHRIC